ncbi:MAG: MATE family efflux transporter, partial [Erysipelotrichia bacterium]|nr:MATE family efflux transporter [Erysipelotrichia bacterium]
FMIGSGGSALTARTMGEGKKELAERYFSMAVIFTVICGIVISILGFVYMRKIAWLLGATAEMIDDCVLYGRILMISTTVFMLQNVFQAFLVTAGKPKMGLMITAAAGITNVILDGLFLGVFGWGIAGAASASVISEFIGGLLPLFYFIRKNDSLLQLRRTSLEIKPLTRICTNGSSEFMSTIAANLTSMMYNHQLIQYVGENGVASYGVVMYVYLLFAAVFMGYSVGSTPIISYQYGAQNKKELKSLYKKSKWIMLVAGVCMTVLAELFCGRIASLFVGYDDALCQMTTHAFQIYSLNFILCGFNIFASSFFTALNNGRVSAAISFIRTLVLEMACVLILPRIFGIEGIWAALPLSGLLSSVVASFYLHRYQKVYGY